MSEHRVVLVIQASKGSTATQRLEPVAQALSDVGLDSEFVAYDGAAPDLLRSRLAHADGVLVWVDPVPGDGQDRLELDALLRDVAAAGVWVSAHPDTIAKMGTKEVLSQTRELGWGCDMHLYRTADDFIREFPAVLSEGTPRVLKPYRGNGGIGVQKVELVAPSPERDDLIVRVQSARLRDEATEDVPLQTFIESCAHHFNATSGPLIDQPFQPRITEGIIRCYVVKDEVVGFARQLPSEPMPGVDPAARRIFGLPAQKTMFAPDEPQLRTLRQRVESEWVPAMQELVDVDTASLPVLWDADFLLGPKTATGEDTYVLCEINVSSVLPFPPTAPPKVARATLSALRGRR